ncbi:MAG TPA: UDP-3-O-[3-hydroxymyristoyl] N-acetylglucosamine deacetylase [Flavobacteriales bacterium]|jgi:UDP-3-O-[3-hydroxymyristoyl] N-acetylglucosamine deacetylase / 3-hydroxyacyl-[acyl-carrier-protein] dehydratase|nr:bifunctional UDP-3-O-[3-hydroxymyristoyl] N-acetylglucosamine deacetylase/3-hydroxyacyl-ACP dehydratase [Flavobacteriales bacterium]HAW21169.1 UDP-3-O-[3-hydroxymyristoyl] N-acetylglucosamine deacetylase [Flavobacteriales bacterium]
MAEKQKTLKASFTISGVGLHTGQNTKLTVHPAPIDHWYRFQRSDIEGQPTIKADVDFVIHTRRGTTLGNDKMEVHTTEHILAALYGMGVDNALIELDGPEIPILDGSAKHFVEAIEAVGIEEQDAEKDFFILKENITFEDPEREVEMLAVPSPDYRITVMVDYRSPMLGTQHASMYKISEFKDEFSRCRTFVFLRELMQLVNAGLVKGGDVDNAIVMVDTLDFTDEEIDRLANAFNREREELQSVGIGILNNVKLHFQNEPARHKLLDIIGDLALVGKPIQGHILAARPGHTTNVAFAKILKDHIKKEQRNIPQFDLMADSIYGITEISEMLPHRYPFLLVDKIIEMGEDYVVGVKNVTMNEEFFQGHFPGNPVMPGVLQVEAMAQTGGILTMSQIEDPWNYETLFVKIDKVKFKRKVVPGDTLVFKLSLLGPVRRGLVNMKGEAYVRNQLVSEGELMAQIIKVRNDERVASQHTS